MTTLYALDGGDGGGSSAAALGPVEDAAQLQRLQAHARICTLSYKSERVFFDLVARKKSPQRAFLTGDVSVKGDRSVLKDLGAFLKLAAAEGALAPPPNGDDGDDGDHGPSAAATTTTTNTHDDDDDDDGGGGNHDGHAQPLPPLPELSVQFLPVSQVVRGADDVVRYGLRCVCSRPDDPEAEPHVWAVHKRFTEFALLDKALRQELSSSRSSTTPARRGSAVPRMPKTPSRGHIFQDHGSKSFIVKRHGELQRYLHALLDMLNRGDGGGTITGRALLSPTMCEFLVVPAGIGQRLQQQHQVAHVSSRARSASRSRARSNLSSLSNVSSNDGTHPRVMGRSASFSSEMSGGGRTPTPTPPASVVGSAAAAAAAAVPPSPAVIALRKQVDRQRQTIDRLAQTQRHEVLSAVQRLENLGSNAAWATLSTASAALVGMTVKWAWQAVLGRRRRRTSPLRLALYALLVGLGWRAKRRVEAASVQTNGWKRKASIFYGTCVILGTYKLTRWRAKSMDAETKDLTWTHVNSVMACFTYRCISRWAGFWTKAGQYMSARADVVPSAFVKELSQLQDGTVAQPFHEVRVQVEAALNAKRAAITTTTLTTSDAADIAPRPPVTIEDVFSHFDEKALASASIAQVHRARLRSTGEHVVVKVQHAGIDRLMKLDMAALLRICRFVAWTEPEFNFEPLMAEWTKAAVKELDFVHEATSLTAVADGLADPSRAPARLHPAHVRVPRCYDDYTTRGMMVLEYSPGVSVGSEDVSRGLDEEERSQLLLTITEATAHQIFHVGVFNGESLPTNVSAQILLPSTPSPT